jgi:hypothetical protein
VPFWYVSGSSDPDPDPDLDPWYILCGCGYGKPKKIRILQIWIRIWNPGTFSVDADTGSPKKYGSYRSGSGSGTLVHSSKIKSHKEIVEIKVFLTSFA